MRFCPVDRQRGAKLWEWAVIVAIIALLAAIAVPNFLEGSYPGKVSPARWRMRQTDEAFKKFRAETGAYPGQRPLRDFAKKVSALDRAGGTALFAIDPGSAERKGLTTPIPYLESLMVDPFAPEKGMPFAYFTDGTGWILFSPGPDEDYDILPKRDYDSGVAQPSAALLKLAYNPTNGTVSDGDIFRVSQ